MGSEDSRHELFEQLQNETECLRIEEFLASRGGVRPLKHSEVFLFLGHPRQALSENSSVQVIFSHHFGAPAVVAKLEELRAKGLLRLSVFGHGAWLSPDLAPGNLDPKEPSEVAPAPGHWVQVHEALSCEGTSFYYGTPWGSWVATQALSSALPSMKSLLQVRVASTDALFRETPQLLRFWREKGVQVLDMESSAILSWCRWRKIPTRIFLHLSDVFEEDMWKPHRWSLEASELQSFVDSVSRSEAGFSRI